MIGASVRYQVVIRFRLHPYVSGVFRDHLSDRVEAPHMSIPTVQVPLRSKPFTLRLKRAEDSAAVRTHIDLILRPIANPIAIAH